MSRTGAKILLTTVFIARGTSFLFFENIDGIHVTDEHSGNPVYSGVSGSGGDFL